MKSYKNYTDRSENTTNGKSDTTSAEELAKKIAQAYDGKSNLEMLRNILVEAERSKRAGTLSNEEIENFYQSFSPMLNGLQRRQLRGVIDRLKEI